MPSRHSAVPNLDLSSFSLQTNMKISTPLSPGGQSSEGPSPLTPRSPKSPSGSPFFKGTTIRPVTQDSNTKSNSPTFPVSPSLSYTAEPSTPGVTAIPQYPPSPPKDSPRHTRDASRSFLTNLKAPKSSHRTQRSDSSNNSGDKPKSRGSSTDRKIPIPSKQSESSPDLLGSVPRADENNHDQSEKVTQLGIKKVGSTTETTSVASKKNKPRFAHLLSRSRSIRLDESSTNRIANRRPSTSFMKLEDTTKRELQEPPRSATVRPERPIKGNGNSVPRNYAAQHPTEVNCGVGRKDKNGGSMVPSASLSQVSGGTAALFNNLKQSSSSTADRIGKVGKGFFGKITRSGSTGEREFVNDDNYVCSVINLSVIEQARRTRISKRLEDCKDKTEFWMPALPYRCVDYLNFKGCEEEGLYRVPGSGKEVKHWQRRFDTELDIDLFEEPDLYDINTIGSLFKAWLRELPDEIFPKETQAKIAKECEGATTAPQMLKDELSKLPPYHYYLLFAITCHLNLLHSYVDQNKMDYRNLCICFQPCMKIDAYCFQFLVCDWKSCWQGCWTEKEYIQVEKEMDEKEQAADRANEEAESEPLQPSERAISSSGSSQPAAEEEPPRTPSSPEKSRRGPSRSPASRSPTSHPPTSRPPTSRPEASRPEASRPEASRPEASRLDKPRPATSKGRKPKPKNIETSHTRSVSQLPELGPPLSPIRI